MDEREEPCVKRETAEGIRQAAAVDRIPEDGVAGFREVHANLVAPASLESHIDFRELFAGRDGSIMRDRFLPLPLVSDAADSER